VSAERERLQLLQATTQEIIDRLPAWDGESPSVLVVVLDPVTRQRLGHWRTPATAAAQPQPQRQPRGRRLYAVPDAS
jgi:hypothetical protein